LVRTSLLQDRRGDGAKDAEADGEEVGLAISVGVHVRCEQGVELVVAAELGGGDFGRERGVVAFVEAGRFSDAPHLWGFAAWLTAPRLATHNPSPAGARVAPSVAHVVF
jgi:hypothetical protein